MKHIALYPNETKDKGFQVTQMVADVLLAHGARLSVEKSCQIPKREGLSFAADTDELMDRAEAVVTLGGDGTMLNIAAKAAKKKLPILGINLGRVGFMAELEVKKLELLKKLFEGGYSIEERMMLDVSVNGDTPRLILNDAVVTARRRRMMDLALWENHRRLGTFRADGLILSTPTGSTAYSLSAGGPVVDPRLKVMLAIPICSHSLGARPIVFAPDATLRVRETDCPAQVTLDGKDVIDLSPEDEVSVCASSEVTRLIQLSDRQFYTAVRSYFS